MNNTKNDNIMAVLDHVGKQLSIQSDELDELKVASIRFRMVDNSIIFWVFNDQEKGYKVYRKLQKIAKVKKI